MNSNGVEVSISKRKDQVQEQEMGVCVWFNQIHTRPAHNGPSVSANDDDADAEHKTLSFTLLFLIQNIFPFTINTQHGMAAMDNAESVECARCWWCALQIAHDTHTHNIPFGVSISPKLARSGCCECRKDIVCFLFRKICCGIIFTI